MRVRIYIILLSKREYHDIISFLHETNTHYSLSLIHRIPRSIYIKSQDIEHKVNSIISMVNNKDAVEIF